MNSTQSQQSHIDQAVASGRFLFGIEDGSVLGSAANLSEASIWALRVMTPGCGVAVFTPSGAAIPASDFLSVARRQARLFNLHV